MHGRLRQFIPHPESASWDSSSVLPRAQDSGARRAGAVWGLGGWRSCRDPGLHAKALGCTSEGPKEPRERALTWPQEATSKIAGLHGEMTWPGARRPLCSNVARLATEVTAISGLAWW